MYFPSVVNYVWFPCNFVQKILAPTTIRTKLQEYHPDLESGVHQVLPASPSYTAVTVNTNLCGMLKAQRLRQHKIGAKNK